MTRRTIRGKTKKRVKDIKCNRPEMEKLSKEEDERISLIVFKVFLVLITILIIATIYLYFRIINFYIRFYL